MENIIQEYFNQDCLIEMLHNLRKTGIARKLQEAKGRSVLKYIYSYLGPVLLPQILLLHYQNANNRDNKGQINQYNNLKTKMYLNLFFF